MTSEANPCIKCGATDRYKSGRCRPCGVKYGCAWRLANRGKRAASTRAWTLANPEKKAASNCAWRLANPEKVVANARAWYLANPAKVAAKHHRRRASKNANGGILKAADIKAIYVAYPVCLACGADDNLSLDHVIPLARGGRNSIENIQVLCCRCNASKGINKADYRDGAVERWRQMALELGGL